MPGAPAWFCEVRDNRQSRSQLVKDSKEYSAAAPRASEGLVQASALVTRVDLCWGVWVDTEQKALTAYWG
jgi:hypothetical protein